MLSQWLSDQKQDLQGTDRLERLREREYMHLEDE